MANRNFFRATYVEETSFFDEGPVVPIVKPTAATLTGSLINTSSIDTSQIDAFRQGVELTQIKHFDAGLGKIHAGEPGHVLHRNNYGMDRNFRTNPWFEELDYFNPKEFLRAQDEDSPLYFNILTFPIITSTNDQIENYVFDGVIEPLTIRSKASFFSIDAPFEAHDTKASLMGGNTDTTHASDQVQTVYKNERTANGGFLDQYADARSFPGEEGGNFEQHVSSIVGFFMHDKRPSTPFSDVRYPRNVPIPTNYDQGMYLVTSMLKPASDDYVSEISNTKSATCGWDYDCGASQGTDSLAFGGMVY